MLKEKEESVKIKEAATFKPKINKKSKYLMSYREFVPAEDRLIKGGK